MYAEKLCKIRKFLRFTQGELAVNTGISIRAYSSYERGERNPSLEFLKNIENLYNVNLNWLIADDGEMFNSAQKSEYINKTALNDEVIKILKSRGLIN